MAEFRILVKIAYQKGRIGYFFLSLISLGCIYSCLHVLVALVDDLVASLIGRVSLFTAVFHIYLPCFINTNVGYLTLLFPDFERGCVSHESCLIAEVHLVGQPFNLSLFQKREKTTSLMRKQEHKP